MPEFDYSSMYGGDPYKQTNQTKQTKEKDKSASRVLGGMKIHNSHIKKVEIDGELVDVPKIEYMKLLEQQIKELKHKSISQGNKIDRLQEQLRTLTYEVKQLKNKPQSRTFTGFPPK